MTTSDTPPQHVIDGAQGEGGGQILRTSIGLSLVTGDAIQIDHIRAGRQRPGLLRQHLTAVLAACEISDAEASGASLGSRSLTFRPGAVQPGTYRFAVGTAGSATLVLQTVLPALLVARGPSQVTVEGGTHNPSAPTFDFLSRSFLPLIERMGPRVSARLERYGFYPAGGGRIVVDIEPAERLTPLDLTERGDVHAVEVRALVANLPGKIGQRELKVVAKALGGPEDAYSMRQIQDSAGPGNVLFATVQTAALTTVVTEFGMKGRPAQRVASGVATAVQAYLASDAPVGPHLADQLLVPLALARGGVFRATEWTPHAQTNAEVIERHLGVPIRAVPEPSGAVRVLVG